MTEITEAQGKILDNYVDMYIDEIQYQSDRLRTSLANELKDNLHSDAHWLPKTSCSDEDAQKIIDLDNMDRDQIMAQFMIRVCRKLIDRYEEAIVHLEND